MNRKDKCTAVRSTSKRTNGLAIRVRSNCSMKVWYRAASVIIGNNTIYLLINEKEASKMKRNL